ncbi:flavin-containing monooxygenase [Rhizobium sullae]|uniref:NAD(P)/FAD-dependent oxidoreductase n=1 Tax=Rhizobium sullae TaxID=50338 RepID=A0ABY5XRS0_RHISU|nr:NAD(P)/FAD-dependent oxidoreductase [Rhizobium sullae]UWU17143.1 NAD(P)/FAD-dependent oxidoreductase [Rhizobium sullae]
MSEVLDALVIGAGSAGLGVSYFLKRAGRNHHILDRGRIGETWRTQRWNSFRLNSPTIRSILPGDSYEGPDPWGAITHHEFVAYLEGYAERHCLPVVTQTPVDELSKDNGLFRVATAHGPLLAHNVVIATGDQNRQVRPLGSTALPIGIHQVDSSAYRSTADLENGAVLVVGSGQSGGQIAEDLARAGRTVFLATSRNGRWVRHYRAGNILNWLTLSGFLDVPRKELVLPSGKLPARALVGATHTISLQSLSAQGVVLLGRFGGVENGSLIFGDDVDGNMRFADDVSANTKRLIDEYIERAGLDAPPAESDPAETVEPRVPDPRIRSVDWIASGVRSVVWCTGFTGDFSWIRLPGALDTAGQPVHEDGVGTIPGLFFAGLDFGSTRKSGTIPAIAEEAARLVERLVGKKNSTWPAR